MILPVSGGVALDQRIILDMVLSFDAMIYFILLVEIALPQSRAIILQQINSTCNNPVTIKFFNRATVAENNIYSLTRENNGNTALFRFDARDGKWYNLNDMLK
uniref:Uncharacterized protein n=1 Tax=Glossina palpalis gambiensis TaxID=67801 RepID=A0A1B0BGR3_9MUSC